jgi:hypothetical protein
MMTCQSTCRRAAAGQKRRRAKRAMRDHDDVAAQDVAGVQGAQAAARQRAAADGAGDPAEAAADEREDDADDELAAEAKADEDAKEDVREIADGVWVLKSGQEWRPTQAVINMQDGERLAEHEASFPKVPLGQSMTPLQCFLMMWPVAMTEIIFNETKVRDWQTVGCSTVTLLASVCRKMRPAAGTCSP